MRTLAKTCHERNAIADNVMRILIEKLHSYEMLSKTSGLSMAASSPEHMCFRSSTAKRPNAEKGFQCATRWWRSSARSVGLATTWESLAFRWDPLPGRWRRRTSTLQCPSSTGHVLIKTLLTAKLRPRHLNFLIEYQL